MSLLCLDAVGGVACEKRVRRDRGVVYLANDEVTLSFTDDSRSHDMVYAERPSHTPKEQVFDEDPLLSLCLRNFDVFEATK